jgi:hypothetical protein
VWRAGELPWCQECAHAVYIQSARQRVGLLLVLFALSGSDVVSGRWVLLIVAAAFVAPLTLALWPKPRYAAVSERAPMVPR